MTERDSWTAMSRGWRRTCPSCGTGRLYGAYLKVNDTCGDCGQELHHQRADDAPPYFTMFIVSHIVVALVILVEKKFQPDVWVHTILWAPLTILLSLWLLPRVKGALIGQQWAMRMHGFGLAPDPVVPENWPAVRSNAESRSGNV